MASDHSGEKAIARSVTVTKLSDPKSQLAADSASKYKLVAPVAAIPTALTPSGSQAVLVKDALASVTQSAKAHIQPGQGKRVILTPLQTTPIASSSSSSAVPPAPPSSSTLLTPLHPVRGAISVPLTSPAPPPQPATVYLDSGDHNRTPHLRPVPPLIQDVPPPLQQAVHNGVAADVPSGDVDGLVPPQGGGTSSLASDHSYAARELPVATPTAPPTHSTMSDSAEDLSGASSDEGDSSSGIPLRPGSGSGPGPTPGPGPSSAPPKLLKKRGRPPSSSALNNTPGAKRSKEGLSPPQTPSTGGKSTVHSDSDKSRRRGRGCGGCPSCLRDDCGVCRYCKDKPKFGGPGKKKQRCALRICSNFVSTPASQKKKQKPAAILPRPQSQVPPLMRPTLPSGTTAAERPQPNTEGVARVQPMEVIRQPPQTSSYTATATAVSVPSLPAPVKPPAEKMSVGEAIGVTVATVNSMEHPIVIAAPPQITLPCAKEKPLETVSTSAVGVVENGASGKKQQQQLHSEVRVTVGVVAPVCPSPKVPLENNAPERCKDVLPAIAEDKTEPAPVVAKVPRTRSQAGREMSQNVPSPAAEKAKAPVKQAEGRKRRTLGSFGDFKMKCLFCGRQRKLAVARSEKFCTQRCIQQWSEAHPGEDPEASASEEEQTSGMSPATRSKKPANSRELKNLQIDMALPGKTPPHVTPPQRSSPNKSLPPRSLGLSPVTTPTVSGTKTLSSAKTTSVEDTGHTNSGTKRAAATPQPEPKKKPCEGNHHSNNTNSKGHDLNSSTRPTTTMVLPISGPLLTRTVPPPPVSIMHMNQIPSLAYALSNLTEPRSHSRGLSSNIHNWSVEQVVQYFESTQDCRDYAEVFQEQDVDGSALLLLTHESLVKCLGIKLGRALKIMLHVDELKKFQESSE